MCPYGVNTEICLQCIHLSMRQKSSTYKLDDERKSEILMCAPSEYAMQ